MRTAKAAPAATTADALTRVWLPETLTRLNQVRRQYDPDGIFTFDLH